MLQGRFRLDIRKNFFSEGVVLPRGGGSLSMEVFQSCGDVALRDVGTVGWVGVGLGDHMLSQQPDVL